MPESKPPTAAESALNVLRNGIDSAEVWLDKDMPDADLRLHVTLRLCDARALLAERDALAAQLEVSQAALGHVKSVRHELEAQLAEAPLRITELEGQLAEARGIARRLVDGFRCSHRGMNPQPMLDALAAFDALHWPDP